MVENLIYRKFLPQLRFPRKKVEFSYHVTYVNTTNTSELRENAMFFYKKIKKTKKNLCVFYFFYLDNILLK